MSITSIIIKLGASVFICVLLCQSDHLSSQVQSKGTMHIAADIINAEGEEHSMELGNTKAAVYSSYNRDDAGKGQFSIGSEIDITESFHLKSCISLDVNSNGITDLVCLSDKYQAIIWFENLGNSFDSHKILYELSADWDALHDLRFSNNTNEIYLSKEQANKFTIARLEISSATQFEFKTSFIVPGNLIHRQFVDLNHDGLDDLIYFTYGTNGVYWHENLGNGIFNESEIIHTDNGIDHLSFGHLNLNQGQENPEFCMVTYEDGQLNVYRQEPNLQFGFVHSAIVEDSARELKILSNENGQEGRLFLFFDEEIKEYDFTANEEISLFESEELFFDSGSLHIISKDLNEDGIIDMIVNQTDDPIHIFHSNTQSSAFDLVESLESPAKGKGLLLLSNGSHNIVTYGENEIFKYTPIAGSSGAYSLQTTGEPLETGSNLFGSFDLNNDGKNELLFRGSSQTKITIKEFNSSTSIIEHSVSNMPGGGPISNFTTADINGDNLLDLVFMGFGTLFYMINNGNFEFADAIELVSDDVETFHITDINQDGSPDLVLYKDTFPNLVSLLNQGSGTFDIQEIILENPNLFNVRLTSGDVNGDGLRDIVAYSGSSNFNAKVHVFEQSEINSFTEIISSYQFAGSNPIHLLDLYGDGFPELTVSFNSTISYFNNPNGSLLVHENALTENILVSSVDLQMPINIVEVNGDQYGEILYLNQESQLHWLRILNGLAIDKTLFTEFDRYDFDATANIDIDDDEDPDILAWDESRNRFVLFQNMPSEPITDYGSFKDCGQTQFVNFSQADFSNSTIEWSFGDGHTSNEIHPSHNFPELGSYLVSLTVCNEAGCDTEELLYTSQYAVDFDIPSYGVIGEPVSFQSISSGHSNVTWLFGDDSNSIDSNTSHVYDEEGTYLIELFLTDNTITDCTFYHSQEITIGTTGVPDPVIENPIIVSPNCNRGKFTLHGIDEEAVIIRIHSITGMEVYSLSAQSNLSEFNLKGLKPGIYSIATYDRSNTLIQHTRLCIAN